MKLALLIVAVAAHLTASQPMDYSECTCGGGGGSPFGFRSFIVAMRYPPSAEDGLDAAVQQPEANGAATLNSGDLRYEARFPGRETGIGFFRSYANPRRYEYTLQTPAEEAQQPLQADMQTRINRWDYSPQHHQQHQCTCSGPCQCRPPPFAPMVFHPLMRHRRSTLTGSEEVDMQKFEKEDKNPVNFSDDKYTNNDSDIIALAEEDDWEVERE